MFAFLQLKAAFTFEHKACNSFMRGASPWVLPRCAHNGVLLFLIASALAGPSVRCAYSGWPFARSRWHFLSFWGWWCPIFSQALHWRAISCWESLAQAVWLFVSHKKLVNRNSISGILYWTNGLASSHSNIKQKGEPCWISRWSNHSFGHYWVCFWFSHLLRPPSLAHRHWPKSMSHQSLTSPTLIWLKTTTMSSTSPMRKG